MLTQNADFACEGAVIVHNKEELAAALTAYDSDDVFVIGGASIYAQLLNLCDTAYITKIDASYAADAYFPDLDKDADWTAEKQSEEKEYEGVKYRFLTYSRAVQNPCFSA